MPTRFTAPIYDGEDITFEQFANSCLRNFGIYLRFEGKYPNLSRYEIPDKICPSDYYKKKYEEAKAEYEKHLASPKTKEELEAEYLSYVNDVIKGNEAHQVNPSTVCQFTGMRDCEGKEIWESDIVHDNYDRLCIDNLYEEIGRAHV